MPEPEMVRAAVGAGDDPGLGIALVVAPASGRLHVLPPGRLEGGSEWVVAGQTLLQVVQAGGSVDVLAPVTGRLGGLLRRQGEPVTPGEPVAWIEPGEAR